MRTYIVRRTEGDHIDVAVEYESQGGDPWHVVRIDDEQGHTVLGLRTAEAAALARAIAATLPCGEGNAARPTREQVDAALRRAEHGGGKTPPLTTDVLAAEVRALRAELEQLRKAKQQRDKLAGLCGVDLHELDGEEWDL